MRISRYLGFLISAILLGIIIYKVNFYDIRVALSKADYIYLIPALILYIGSFVVRTLRWQVMLSSLKVISMHSSFAVIMIAWMTNNVLPARMGEFVRAYVIGKKENISKAAALATIVVERVFDGLTLVSFLLILLLLNQFPRWVIRIGYLSALLFISVLIFLIGLKVYPNFITGNIRKITRHCPERVENPITALLTNFIDGLQFLSAGKQQLIVIIYSLFVWILEGFMYYCVVNSFHLTLPIYAAFFLLVIVNLGLIFPSAPGYIGTYQFFTILALKVFGIDRNIALPFSIVLHVLQYFPVTLLGLIYFNREGLRWKEVRKIQK